MIKIRLFLFFHLSKWHFKTLTNNSILLNMVYINRKGVFLKTQQRAKNAEFKKLLFIECQGKILVTREFRAYGTDDQIKEKQKQEL